MKQKRNVNSSAQYSKSFKGEGTNWILIAGGALLSTLSIRLGYKLKQVLDTRRLDNASTSLKGNRKSSEKRRSGTCALHSNMYPFTEDEDACYSCLSGMSEGMVDSKRPAPGAPILKENDSVLPLVAISSAPDPNRENGVMWSSSDSPCVSESGSDIFSKREVIHKLRQQLKRRDDMIMEMHDQVLELQSSLGSQLSHTHHLQSQLDAANRDLFDSEREIQRLRKAIADHCVKRENGNGVVNGFYSDGEMSFDSVEKGRGEERIEMLKREVGELKEVIEGKDYLLQSYKEQKTELCSKVVDLQQRLVCHVPNIL